MPETIIVASFPALLQAFSSCFTAPSFQSFVVLCCGWVLTMGRHTVSGAARAANAVGWKRLSSFHRFFSAAQWLTDEVGLVLVRMIDALVPDGEPIIAAVDDTLGRHTGKTIAAASMHRDPLLSTATRVFFHWGHVWVVLGITIRAFGKAWCLPVLFRLYRGHKVCEAERRPHRKTTQMAAELLRVLAEALPHRRIFCLGDGAYTNASVIKGRPPNVTVIGRSRLDAALYAPPPRRRPGQKGRPRVRGDRLPSPAQQAASPRAPWQTIEIDVYGKRATVRVLVINALWYIAAGGEVVRLVVVRGFPGHERDDAFVCTDPTLDPKTILELMALRWPLETTFQEAKGKLGFEQPPCQSERAVERTAPMALWLYTLVVLWYLRVGHKLRTARQLRLQWYPSKAAPAFSDMLATLRRASWAERLFDPLGNHSTFQKHLKPFLDYLDTVAAGP